MAKFKSTIFSEIRGSVNGLTFSRVKGAAIVRNRTVPVQPNTTSQSVVRAWFQTAANYFAGLNASEVDSWDNAISSTSFQLTNNLGDSYTPSAKQLTVAMKLNFLTAGSVNNPDVSKFIANPITPDVLPGAASILVALGPPVALTSFNVDATSTDPAAIMQVKATQPLRPSITNYKKYLRSVYTGAAGPTDISSEYETVFPGIDWSDQVGNRVGIAYRTITPDTGLASAWLYAELVTIPAAV